MLQEYHHDDQPLLHATPTLIGRILLPTTERARGEHSVLRGTNQCSLGDCNGNSLQAHIPRCLFLWLRQTKNTTGRNGSKNSHASIRSQSTVEARTNVTLNGPESFRSQQPVLV
jgi:hypothetical protein